MTVAAIIQARMASTRLPGKSLAELGGEPLLAHVVRRTRAARRLARVVVATTTDPSDDVLAHACHALDVTVVRGSPDDVLARYVDAARAVEASVVVRVTADCPFIDPAVIDRVVDAFSLGECDYASNTLHCTYPDGLDTEVFSMDALLASHARAERRSEREHVTPYMKSHPERFRLTNVRHDIDLSWMRWTVDEPRDLAFARAVRERTGPVDLPFEALAALLRADEALLAINRGIIRDEGYARSLREDGPATAPGAR